MNSEKGKSAKNALAGIVVCVLVLGIIAALAYMFIANSKIEAITAEEITNEILADMQPQVDKIKSDYGYDDLTLEVAIQNIKIEKPKIHRDGELRVTIMNYLRSDSFTEFDGDEVSKADVEKYYKLSSLLDYSEVEIDKYNVWISAGSTGFINANEDMISVSYRTVHKNGSVIYNEYEIPTDNSSSSDSNSSSSGNSGSSGSNSVSQNKQKVCVKCGHPAEYLAANGYCKVCVDVYMKDYYIGLDGNVYPDR